MWLFQYALSLPAKNEVFIITGLDDTTCGVIPAEIALKPSDDSLGCDETGKGNLERERAGAIII